MITRTKATIAAAVFLLALFRPFSTFGEPSGPAVPETASIRVNGLDIGYRVLGNGEPLVMIMGYAGTMDVWDPTLIEELSRSYRVIVYDNRGIGYSSGRDAPISIRVMAEDAAGLLAALNIERTHILGWSMGAMVAQELALAYPERVDKLVLYGTAYDSKPVIEAIDRMGAATPETLLPMLFPAPWLKGNPEIFERLPVPSVPPDAEVVERQRTAVANWSGGDVRLAALRMPVLLVSGEADDVTPVRQSVHLASVIEGAWLARFRGAGHWLMYQAPHELARLVTGFLSARPDLLGQAP